MTALPEGRAGQALALALALAVAGAAWLGAVSPALDWFGARQQQLAQRTALAARMQAVAGTVPALREAAQRVAGHGPAAPALLAGGTDAVAGATLQQAIQDMARQAGATLASAETLPAEAAAATRRIGVRITLTAPWAVLLHLLQAIDLASPRMLVDDLQVQAALALPGADQPLSTSFTVFAFRAAEPAT